MKKFVIAFLLVLSTPFSLFAEKPVEVSLRFSRQDAIMRIVLDADENAVKNTNTVASLSAIKIEFPAEFELKKPKDFAFETVKKDRMLIINLKDVSDAKVTKLSSPPRIVIDLKSAQAAPKEAPQQPTQKPLTPAPGPVKAPQEGQPVEKAVKSRIIVIDPGHGGYDYGIVVQDSREKDVNLRLSGDLGSALSKKGQKVFQTRRVDQSVPIAERINFAGGKKPDIFLGLHASLADHFVIYTSNPDELNADAQLKQYSLSLRQARFLERSRSLAKVLAESLKNDFNTTVLLRELPLPILSSMNAPAVLIEYPYLKTYASDQKLRDRFINSVMKGLSSYEQ